MILPWRLVDSRYLIRDRWMTLRADRCELPEGGVVDPYYVQESPDWVQVVAFDALERILITRQYRHGAGVVCAEVPCGNVESGELPEQAMRRELLEETGCAVETLEPLSSLYSNPARDCNRIHAFVATGARCAQSQRLDSTESIEFEFLPIPEVLRLMDSGGFPQALHVAHLLLALRRRCLLPLASPL